MARLTTSTHRRASGTWTHGPIYRRASGAWDGLAPDTSWPADPTDATAAATGFTGLADGAAWPAPWTQASYPAGSIRDVQGQAGRLVTATTLGIYNWDDASAIRLPDEYANFEARFRLRSYGQGYPRFVFRSGLPQLTHENCVYLAGQINTSTPGTSFRVDEATNWNQTMLARTSGAWPTGEWVNVRVRAEGARVRMRRWDDGAAEPSTWPIDVTVTKTSPGYLGFIIGPAATATGYRMDVDDFAIWNLTPPTP